MREYTISEENCAWCNSPIPEELMSSTYSVRYCCAEHARAALSHRDFRERKSSDRGYSAALDVIQRSKNPSIACEECGKRFRPVKPTIRHCSFDCRSAGLRKLPDIDCGNCGRTFRPKNADVRFCSRACSGEAHRKQPLKNCDYCHEPFRTKNPDKLYCSMQCWRTHQKEVRVTKHCDCCGREFQARRDQGVCGDKCHQAAYRMKKGIFPKKMDTRAFDFLFTKPINSASRELTSERFDRLIAA